MRVFGGSIAGSNSIIADDNASNYSSAPTDGSNPGYGFLEWDILANTSGGFAGVFLGPVNAGFGDINTGGNSIGMFGGTNAFNGVDFARDLPSTLSVGFALSGIMACRWRDGSRGFSVYRNANKTDEIFNLNIDNTGYKIDGGSDLASFADDMIIRIILKATGSNTYDYSAQFKNATPVTGSKSNGPIRGWKHYVYGTPGGSNNDFFCNSWKVYRY